MQLIRVAIVDDELIARNRLKSFLSYRKNLKICVDTSNPEEVLEYIKHEDLDLIFLDMSMPKMNGVTFLKHLRNLDEKTAVVVTSGYADFAYAKESIHYGVKDYILKHQLTESLMDECLAKIFPMMEVHSESFDSNFFKDNDFFLLDRKSQIKYLKLHEEKMLEHNLIGLIIFPIDNKSMIDNKKKFRKKAMNLISDFLQANIAADIPCLCSQTSAGGLNCLFSFHEYHSFTDIYSYLENVVKKIRKIAKHMLDIQLYIQTTPIFQNFEEGLSYFPTDDTVENELFYHPKEFEKRNIVLASYYQHQLKDSIRNQLSYFLELLKFDIRYLRSEKSMKDIECLLEYINTFHGDKRVTIAVLAEIEFVVNHLFENGFPQQKECDTRYFMTFLNEFGSISDYLIQIVNCAQKTFMKMQFEGKDENICKSLLFINHHFNTEISLQSCAEHVHVNYSYLSRIFKKQLGCSFSGYLNRLRIDFAKILLEYHIESIHEIAEQCGFSNYNYFFVVFKDLENCSPQEYINFTRNRNDKSKIKDIKVK